MTGSPTPPEPSLPASTLPPSTDWLLRPFEATRVHFAWVALGISVLLGAGFLLMRVVLDREHLVEYAGVDLLMALVFGYLLGATVYLRRSAPGDFAELRPVLLGGAEEISGALRAVVCPGRRPLLQSGLLMGALWGLGPTLDPGFWIEERPALTSPIFLYFSLRQAAMGFVIGRVLLSEVISVRAYGRLGATQVAVDLLDVGPLRPFARRGLRSGFVWILCSSLVSLFWLGPATANTNGPVIVAIGVLVTLGFLRCVSGVRASIRRAKQERLALLRSEIRQESDALLAPGARTGDARLANLIALQGLVERVPEWPFDAPVLLRAALIALLGLGSWLGGALVERLLDTALS